MEIDEELSRLAERTSTLENQRTSEGEARALLRSLLEAPDRVDEAGVTIEEAEMIGEAEGQVACVGDTPVALVGFVDPSELQEVPQGKALKEGSDQRVAQSLCRKLETSSLRFGVLTGGHRLRFYTSFGNVGRPVFNFNLLTHSRREAEQLTVLCKAMLTFGRAEGGPMSIGHGLFYVFAVDNGGPFGMRDTTCKLGVTGVGPESRRRFHELRLGIRGSEELRLCYLAAGAIVAAEKLIRRGTSHMAPPGLGPRSEWRWCPPKRLVTTVKETVRDRIQRAGDRLDRSLEHVTLADPLAPTDPSVSEDPSASESPSATPEPVSRGGRSVSEVGSLGETSPEETPKLGDRLSPMAARRRAAEVKRRDVKGDLEERPDEKTLTFRTSNGEKDLIKKCAEQSDYRSWSAYVRDQALGWNRSASIVAKAGLILHWALAHWGGEVREEEWAQLRGLTEEVFSPDYISNPDYIPDESGAASKDSVRKDPVQKGFSRGDPLRKVFSLAKSHLLAVEPQPLQLLKEQLVKMRRFGELDNITAPVGIQRQRPSGREEQTGWAGELRWRALGVSRKEDGQRTPEGVRMAPAERAVAEKNADASGYASPSSYARNYALGWDRDVLACARTAVALDWIARCAGQPIGEKEWRSLDCAFRDAFETGRLPGANTVRGSLKVVEKHLLQVGRERVTEETDIP